MSGDEHELLHRSGVPHVHGSFEGETARAHDNLTLRTIGIDIGSSTSHLMLGEVHLRRLAQDFSSQYVVMDRRTTWRSDVILTPYSSDGLIDAARLRRFVRRCYQEAGITEESLDTGLVILTGDALARPNARAISAEFADESGRFICALAGHHREAQMAAAGSGAVQLSTERTGVALNVDVGGGTTKLALIENGEILSTAAVAVGARTLLLDDQRVVVHLSPETARIAGSVGVSLHVGDRLGAGDEARLADAMVQLVVRLAATSTPTDEDAAFLVTEPLDVGDRPATITFSGGVSEFVHERELRSFGDLGSALGAHFRRAADSGDLGETLVEVPHGIRATAIGLTQFSVQVSGKTLHLPGAQALPVRNVPVVGPVGCGDTADVAELVARLRSAVTRTDVHDAPLAVAMQWVGPVSYSPLRAVAEALSLFRPVASQAEGEDLLVVILDADVAASLGNLLQRELDPPLHAICLDSIDIEGCDYIDIGSPVGPARLTPVVMKSMLFA